MRGFDEYMYHIYGSLVSSPLCVHFFLMEYITAAHWNSFAEIMTDGIEVFLKRFGSVVWTVLFLFLPGLLWLEGVEGRYGFIDWQKQVPKDWPCGCTANPDGIERRHSLSVIYYTAPSKVYFSQLRTNMSLVCTVQKRVLQKI